MPAVALELNAAAFADQITILRKTTLPSVQPQNLTLALQGACTVEDLT
jgi:hypothetical protein